MIRFDGQVAIVTGAGGNPGLGRSYALHLASLGARVLVNDFGAGPDGRGHAAVSAEAVAEEIKDKGGDAIPDFGDVSTSEGAKQIVNTALAQWGRVDALVNNAGIAPFGNFAEISDGLIEKIVGVHLMGHIWMCRAVWPAMVERGHGRIVNVSSTVAIRGLLGQPIYGTSKLGIVGLTRALATEGRALGITCNAVMPKAETLAWSTMVASTASSQNASQGLTPDSVAPVVAWMAHPSCNVSGKVIQVEGGHANEIFIGHNEGITAERELSAEMIVSQADQLFDRERVTLFSDPDGDTRGVVPRSDRTTV